MRPFAEQAAGASSNVHEREWKNETKVTKQSVPILILDLNSKYILLNVCLLTRKLHNPNSLLQGVFLKII